jgi:hypothetical protein
MFGFGKKNAVIDSFADDLVSELAARFPPGKEQQLGGAKAKPARSLGKVAAELIDRKFAAFLSEHRLGVYGKARVLNRIKWQMSERGYSADFTDVTLGELTRVTGRTAPRQRRPIP